MPTIVIGADTPLGLSITRALIRASPEVRCFVSDAEAGTALKAEGVKVAVGDVSDRSHVGAAALTAYCAVLVGEAAVDARERSFAESPSAVLVAWAAALHEAAITRALWVGARLEEPDVLRAGVAEFLEISTQGLSTSEVVAAVVVADSALSSDFARQD
jgi:putative NADH-flavin reductase